MTERVRVLQVITGFSAQAPAQSASLVAKYLDPRRYAVTAVSLRHHSAQSSPTVAELERCGIPHLSLDAGGQVDLAALARLFRLFRRIRPAVVHSHAFRADAWCSLAGRMAGVPHLVCTVRNHDRDVLRMERDRLTASLSAAAAAWALRRADAVVAVSEGIAGYVSGEGVPADRVHVIRNGFDFDRLGGEARQVRAALGWSPEDVVIGTLAILQPRKGLTYLIEAARSVVAAHPRVRFFIAGEGPQRAELEDAIKRYDLAPRVELLGERRDALDLLRASDVFVLPSLFEGLPRSLLEAMAIGVMPVVTDIGGSREAVEDGVSGLVVPAADAPALAAALNRAAGDASLRGRLAAAASDRVRSSFDARATARAHEALYESLLVRASAGPNRVSRSA
ncbi:MAG: glycosyltransferase [Vicinamibacterales bacterium]